MLVLAFIALMSLRPWEADSVDPHLVVSPGTGALGDAVVVAPDRSPGLAGTGIEGLPPATPAVVELRPAPGGSVPTLAVSQHRAVSAIATPSPSPAPPPPNPESPASHEPAPAPVPPPPASTIVVNDGDGAGVPSTAVVEVEAEPRCEGDEYEITIRFGTKAVDSDEAEVAILIRRVGRDGSESEIQLEGKLGDVGALLERVVTDDDCVEVRLEPASEEEPAQGSSEDTVAPAGLDEASSEEIDGA